AIARLDSPIRIRTRICRYWYISNLRFAMRILLTEKQSTIRELNRSLRGKSGQRGAITPLIRWIDYGANRVAPLAANIVAPLSANELAPYWCQSTADESLSNWHEWINNEQ
ncbi:hypothetical protein, partial [Pseudoalteromonas sp.]|uniref:hypothetical protein n=1 Tax=Pseudoalteromonas sp. TaxID=53249 RepID=UPI002632E35D